MLTHTLTEFHSFIDREPKSSRLKPWLFRGLALWFALLMLSTIALWVQYTIASVKLNETEATVTGLMQSYQLHHPDIALLLDNQEEMYREGGSSYIEYLSSYLHPGVWISGISIDLRKGNIDLYGHALSPQDISIFLANIQKKDSPFKSWTLVSSDSQKSSTNTDNSFVVIMKRGKIAS